MAQVPASSRGGLTAGTYEPVGSQTGVTLDTTTYDDPVRGGGAKLACLVFATEGVALGIAQAGDAHPRWLLTSDANDGLYAGNGTIDAYANGPSLGMAGGGVKVASLDAKLSLLAATSGVQAPSLNQLSPRFTVVAGALPTVALVSGTGAQITTARDAETVTPFTGDGTNNAATCAIALSPDDVTYSALATISIAAALNLTGVLTDTVNARVPAGWYLKLTAVHGTLGTTTYY